MGGQLHRGGERSEIGGEAIHKAIKCRYTRGGASILFRIYFALLIPEEPALQLAPSIFPIASHGRVGRPLEVGSSTPRGRASREGFGRRRRDPRSRRGLSEATSNQEPAGFSPGGRRSVGAGCASRIPKRPGVVIRTPSSGVDGATPSNRAFSPFKKGTLGVPEFMRPQRGHLQPGTRRVLSWRAPLRRCRLRVFASR